MSAALACSAGEPRPRFDGERSYAFLSEQCALGPRVPGTAPHDQLRARIVEILIPLADSVGTDDFTASVGGKEIPLTNILARFRTGLPSRVLLAAHWDTRPRADREKDPAQRSRPIPGANDGASGVAVLVEVARALKEVPPPVGVDVILFDGEDYGEGEEGMFLGSKRFAREWQGRRPLYGVLLDMVGDRDLGIYQEYYSLQAAPEVVDRVWSAARRAGHGEAFIAAPRYAVSDDHLPLLEAGIRCIDVIDFDYPYWHTLEDTPDKCSPESLRAVGEVLLTLIYGEAP